MAQTMPCVDEAEFDHLMIFLLAQLRAECGRIIDRGLDEPYAAFDAEIARADAEFGGRDVAALEAGRLFAEFFEGPARGEKWVPPHTALGEQELFIMRRLAGPSAAPGLSAREKLMLATGFSASRSCALFEAVVAPLFERPAGAAADGGGDGAALLWSSEAFCARGGPLHDALLSYKARTGAPLHTATFRVYPPRGAGGDNFAEFIADRIGRFVRVGKELFETLFPRDGADDGRDGGGSLFARASAELRRHNGIGPTMTKTILVTAQLLHPELALLRDECEVGDGARAGLHWLFPGAIAERANGLAGEARDRALLAALLARATDAAKDGARVARMFKWTAARARERFARDVPGGALPDELAADTLQVQLCEWRKFRTAVDVARAARRGRVAPYARSEQQRPAVAPSDPPAAKRLKASGGGDFAIVVRQTNPKQAGSLSYARYERYKAATTRREYRALGGSAGDFDFDLARGYVEVPGDAADAGDASDASDASDGAVPMHEGEASGDGGEGGSAIASAETSAPATSRPPRRAATSTVVFADDDDESESDASSLADEGDEAAKKKGGDGDAKPACANDVAIVLRQANPKRPGSQSHARYEKYKAATTRSEFRLLGGSSADFKYDLAHGFCSRVF